MQRLERAEVRLGEGGLRSQISEELLVLDEGQRILPLLGGNLLEAVRQPIDDRDGLALLIDAFGVAGPTGHHGR